MNEYHFTVNRSSHCCAVYELAGLAPNVIDSGFVQAIKESAKAVGQPKVLPLLIQFSDSDDALKSKGEALYSLLLREGYKVDRFKLGLNPKSGNNVSLYHWWAHKGRGGPSKVREYKYGQEEQSNASISRTAQTGGAGSVRGNGVGRLLGSQR